LRQPDVGRN